MTTIKVNLGNIGKAIKQVEEYAAWLDKRLDVLIERLGEVGVSVATPLFKNARYDGRNDVVVGLEKDEDKLVLYAEGKAVAFIEFGTGVTFHEHHEWAEKVGAAPGVFGKGMGKRWLWTYFGSAEQGGTHGIAERRFKDGRVLWVTQGNPPARAMYEASKQMREQVNKIAKEVFTR